MTERHHTRIAMAIALFAAIGSAQAASDLKVHLSTDTSSAKNRSVIVTATFTNEGDEAAYIYRPESPFGRYDDEPASDFLKVKDSSGNPVQYIGSRDHWGPVEASHFVTVAPGQSVQKRVDITNAYAFGTGGVFSARYVAYQRRPPELPRRAKERAPLPPLESDDVVLVVDKPSDQQ
ncbi:hypothetical protein L2Y96_13035 [Luteibacter aegosomaticola]|uniref:hypothetical protein n=1 Tax=Luteibacter aegosomaticola TaxID=2911538 RepID=UPI001FF78938|nr:hypothetical protein [Luteibacter aegosomaticola]UPG88344.1 hypothetical protein L2Y96_13035 [Luteibacter aegosomaticola]